MNYRHAFHAGNFADVLKHAALVRILLHLREKPAAFRVIDSHAGAGLYDLSGPEASRTGEWRGGIGRLFGASLPSELAALLTPYLDAVAACNAGGALCRYPGSPLIALSLLREQDRLTACELEPSAAADLKRTLRPDRRAKAVAIDGFVALNAYVPPKERRGLVLIDPPFERPDEFAALAQALVSAWRKWPTGVYLVWRPLKDRRGVASFDRALAAAGMRKTLRVDFDVGAREANGTGLRGAGLLVVNPPWRLADEFERMLSGLVPLLAQGQGGGFRLDWLREDA
jgi:23S rRNA (adenine2030-N6)-methyltransferase